MTKQVKIYIPIDSLNKEVDQFDIFQRDGETVRVPKGKLAVVPLWVAERAKEIYEDLTVEGE